MATTALACCYSIRDIAMSDRKIAVSVSNVTKRYDKTIALNGVSLEVKKGEILGLLGRNGAGKTTLIEILEGIRTADSGGVSVLGFDPTRELYALKQRIGIQLQSSSFFSKLRVIEAIKQFRSYYESKADVESLLEIVA